MLVIILELIAHVCFQPIAFRLFTSFSWPIGKGTDWETKVFKAKRGSSPKSCKVLLTKHLLTNLFRCRWISYTDLLFWHVSLLAFWEAWGCLWRHGDVYGDMKSSSFSKKELTYMKSFLSNYVFKANWLILNVWFVNHH